MKKLLLLLFSLLISFNSYGEWRKVTESIECPAKGDTYYVDIDTIKENGGYVYWYEMTDYFKRDEFGDMSAIIYLEGDCGLNRSRMLSGIFYKQPMCIDESVREIAKNPEWTYTSPGKINAVVLNFVCKNILEELYIGNTNEKYTIPGIRE